MHRPPARCCAWRPQFGGVPRGKIPCIVIRVALGGKRTQPSREPIGHLTVITYADAAHRGMSGICVPHKRLHSGACGATIGIP